MTDKPMRSRSVFLWLVLCSLLACEKKLGGPQPIVSSVSPQVVCNAEHSTEVSVIGVGLSPLNDLLLTGRQLELPQVSLTREQDLTGAPSPAGPVLVPDEPAAPEASDTTWTSQQAMSFRVCPEGTCSTQTPAGTDYPLAPGLYGIGIANRSGKSVSFGSALTVVPRPVLSSVDLDLACQDQENTFELTGDYLLRIDGTGLQVSIGSQIFSPTLLDCRTLPSASIVRVEACRRARVVVPAKTFAQGTYPVHLVGPSPAACTSVERHTVTFVPEPRLTAVVPDVACIAQASRTFRLVGSDFLTVNGALPSIRVGATSFAATTASGCTRFIGPTETVERCDTLTLTLARGALSSASWPVTVTNPAPANCVSTRPVNLTLVEAPVLTSVKPDLACNEQGESVFTLTGTSFLGITTEALPSVTFTGPGATNYTTVPADVSLTPASCGPLTGPIEPAQVCTSLQVRVPRGSLGQSGAYTVVLTNPPPAGCSSAQPSSVMLVPAPHLTAVQPAQVCSAQGPVTLTATGSGFLTVGAMTPTVSFSSTGVPLVVRGGISASGCTAVTGSALSVQSCTSLTVPTPSGAFSRGVVYAVTITNPSPAACASSEVVSFTGAAPPAISQVTPLTLCAGGGRLSLSGTNFEPGATVTAGSRTAATVSVADGGTSLTATFGAGGLGPLPVTLTNPSGCGATAAQQVSVVPGPLLVFVEPRVAWSGMNTPVTVFGASVAVPIVKVQLAPSGSAAAPVDLIFSLAPGHPDRPVAVVPRNTPPGVYDVLLSDQTGCPARLDSALTITANTTLVLTGVSPPFGWTGSATDITVSASNGAPSPGFGPVPGVYLTPSMTQSSVTKLKSVAVLSATGLATEVPAGLAPGSYDLIVVNQDGSVGVRTTAFSVTASHPPVVTSVMPGTLSTNVPSQVVTILGDHFRLPVVDFRCLSSAGVRFALQRLTVQSSTGASLSATVDTTRYPAGANCIVVVTNGDDNSTAEFSSVVVVNSGANLTGFMAGPDLAIGRRSLGAAAGGFSQAARFVYAIAGDDGASALSSVEVLPVDIFGTAGPAFFTQRYGLSAPRTQTTAVRIGRFLYVAGGTTTLGSTAGAMDTLERAVLLDPSTSPVNLSIDLNLVPQSQGGLDNGTFYYRVAAVMAGTDPFNPDGEGLPSDTFGLTLPPLNAYRVQVKLTWDAVPGAAGYRLYRTAANGAAGTETLIADVAPPGAVVCPTPTACTDTGAPELSTTVPLKPGSTGKWVPLSQRMSTGRAGPGVTWALDPALPDRAHLYVFGGLNDAGVAQTSYEYTTVSINSDGGAQTPSAFVSGTTALSTGRWRLGGFTITPSDSTFVGSNTFVWAGPGSAANPATTVASLEGARVLPGGALTNFTPSSQPAPQHAGYGAFAAGDYLYLLGGANGQASQQTGTCQLAAAPAPPDFANIQNFSPGLLVPRVDTGATVQSGYFYSLGGGLADGGVTRSIEYVLY